MMNISDSLFPSGGSGVQSPAPDFVALRNQPSLGFFYSFVVPKLSNFRWS